ncbi:hypothetical protein EIM50_23220 [Pseudoxanthomonas sp. SGD-10]|nr:hypothetical protein EIM50_23220 [Pseudoxanthomonas sp. SGD-10]
MDIVVNSAYHLLDIQNNIGAFDVTQTFIAKSDIAGSDMNVAGKGSGKMLYDVNHKFISKMDIQNFMDMHMKLNEMDAKMKMEMNISQTVNINRN